jgi:hypothetical protein
LNIIKINSLWKICLPNLRVKYQLMYEKNQGNRSEIN